MKKTVKRNWDHIEYAHYSPFVVIVLGCGHKTKEPVERVAGGIRIPPKCAEYDCSLCTRSWKDNLK